MRASKDRMRCGYMRAQCTFIPYQHNRKRFLATLRPHVPRIPSWCLLTTHCFSCQVQCALGALPLVSSTGADASADPSDILSLDFWLINHPISTLLVTHASSPGHHQHVVLICTAPQMQERALGVGAAGAACSAGRTLRRGSRVRCGLRMRRAGGGTRCCRVSHTARRVCANTSCEHTAGMRCASAAMCRAAQVARCGAGRRRQAGSSRRVDSGCKHGRLAARLVRCGAGSQSH